MGRAKLKMELIAKPNARSLTFKKRKKGMMKKLEDLTILCDVGACMIIYDPSQNHNSIWPEPEKNPGQFRHMLDVYRSKSKDTGTIKSYGVSDFLKERKRKAEEELQKLRKNNSEAKYTTWNQHFNSMNESQLRGVAASLLAKSQIIRARIQMMRMREKQDLEMMKNMMLLNSASASASAPPDFSQFYNLDQEYFNPAQFDMSMVVPQNYYTAAPPPQGYPYMVWPNMNMNMGYDQNVSYWGNEGDQVTQYLMQLNS